MTRLRRESDLNGLKALGKPPERFGVILDTVGFFVARTDRQFVYKTPIDKVLSKN